MFLFLQCDLAMQNSKKVIKSAGSAAIIL